MGLTVVAPIELGIAEPARQYTGVLGQLIRYASKPPVPLPTEAERLASLRRHRDELTEVLAQGAVAALNELLPPRAQQRHLVEWIKCEADELIHALDLREDDPLKCERICSHAYWLDTALCRYEAKLPRASKAARQQVRPFVDALAHCANLAAFQAEELVRARATTN